MYDERDVYKFIIVVSLLLLLNLKKKMEFFEYRIKPDIHMLKFNSCQSSNYSVIS